MHKPAKVINLPSSLPPNATVTQALLQPHRVIHGHGQRVSHNPDHTKDRVTGIQWKARHCSHTTASERPCARPTVIADVTHTAPVSVSHTPTAPCPSQRLHSQTSGRRALVPPLSYSLWSHTLVFLSLSHTQSQRSLFLRHVDFSRTYTNTAIATSNTRAHNTHWSPSHANTRALSHTLRRRTHVLQSGTLSVKHTHTHTHTTPPHDLSRG